MRGRPSRVRGVDGHYLPRISIDVRRERVEDLHIKLIILLPQILVNPRRDKRQALPTALTHNNEPQILQIRTQIIRRARQIQHDAPIPPLTQPYKLIILADNLARASRKVQRKGRLVRAEVVDVEDEFLREVFVVAPHDPADARVHEAVFVARHVDGGDFGEAKVPEQARVDKGGDEAAGCGVDVDVDVDVAFDEEVVHGFDVFVFARVGGAEDGACDG